MSEVDIVTVQHTIYRIIKAQYGPNIPEEILQQSASLLLESFSDTLMSICLFTVTPQGRIQISNVTTDGQREPRCADITVILIGAITSAINQYFKVRAGPSGVVCESLGNHYHGLCITSISQVSVNNLGFKN